METWILIGIGFTAVIYLTFASWNGLKGKGTCHCSSAIACNAKACSCNVKRK